MSSEEYLQLFNSICEISYSENSVHLRKISGGIDEIRKLHIKFQNKLEYLLIDPISFEKNDERSDINILAGEIKSICIGFNIKFNCIKIPKDFFEFSRANKIKRNFASYHIGNIDITNLIVFKKSKYPKVKTKSSDSFFNDDNFILYNE